MNETGRPPERPAAKPITLQDGSKASGEQPAFLRKLKTIERDGRWLAPCPDVHASDGYSVAIWPDEKTDRYRFECLEATKGDLCGHERDLIRLLELADAEIRLGASPTDWLIDAADLLAEPDPGPTKWLVEDMIVDQAIVAAVGKWKTTKSYGLLEVCVAVATGHPAFGRLEVPEPGPVVFVNEESGKAALWRRLDSLCRGRGINPEELRGRLLLAPNQRIKLDDSGWQERLIELGQEIRPRLFVFDPLARMKAASRQEKDQSDMGVLVEYMLLLRNETSAAVAFVQHQGHQGEHMRGSSDLESAWETRLRWKRDGQAKVVQVEIDHREAEASPALNYAIKWDGLTRAMRFDSTAEPPTRETNVHDEVVAYLVEHPGASGRDVEDGVTGKASLVRKVLKQLEQAGTHHRAASSKRNAAGRTTSFQGWYPASHAALNLVPDDGTHEDAPSLDDDVRPPDVCLRGTRDGGTRSDAGLELTPDHDEDRDNAPALDDLETFWAEREAGAA